MRAQAAMASRWAMTSSRDRAARKNLWVKPPEPVSVGATRNVSGFGIVQGIIETGNRARAVAKRRVRGDVLDALAIDIDLAAVPQAFEVLGAGERSRRPDHVFWLLPMHRSLRSPGWSTIARRTYCACGSPVHRSSLNRSSNFDEDPAHSR